MTTLVYRAGVLAADSRSNYSGVICPDPTHKVHKLPDGSLFGFAGSITSGMAALAWLQGSKKRAFKLDDHTTVVVVSPEGDITCYEGEACCPLVSSAFYAWGSGMGPALGALYAGASAEEAVRCAIQVDMNSGGEVQTVTLAPKPHRAPRRRV